MKASSKTSIIKALALLTCCFITACSSSHEALEVKYKKTCWGSNTVKCKNLLLDWQESRMSHYLEEVRLNQATIVQEKGIEEYNNLVAHYQRELEAIKDERPGWFLSTFFSDAKVP